RTASRSAGSRRRPLDRGHRCDRHCAGPPGLPSRLGLLPSCSRRAIGSLALAGLAARLAPWFDHFDRHGLLVGGRCRRRALWRLLLRLALLLVARSISALAHWSSDRSRSNVGFSLPDVVLSVCYRGLSRRLGVPVACLHGVAQRREGTVRESGANPAHQVESIGEVVERREAIAEQLLGSKQVRQVGSREGLTGLAGAPRIDRPRVVLERAVADVQPARAGPQLPRAGHSSG